jgi:hypothetical protein
MSPLLAGPGHEVNVFLQGSACGHFIHSSIAGNKYACSFLFTEFEMPGVHRRIPAACRCLKPDLFSLQGLRR